MVFFHPIHWDNHILQSLEVVVQSYGARRHNMKHTHLEISFAGSREG